MPRGALKSFRVCLSPCCLCCLSVCQSVSQSVSQSVCLSVCLSVCVCVCVSVHGPCMVEKTQKHLDHAPFIRRAGCKGKSPSKSVLLLTDASSCHPSHANLSLRTVHRLRPLVATITQYGSTKFHVSRVSSLQVCRGLSGISWRPRHPALQQCKLNCASTSASRCQQHSRGCTNPETLPLCSTGGTQGILAGSSLRLRGFHTIRRAGRPESSTRAYKYQSRETLAPFL